jgi:hypothetical protein
MATAAVKNAMMMRGEKRRGASDARMAVGRGERGGREEGAARWPAPLEADAGEGWGFGLWCRAAWRRKWCRERGLGFNDVDRHGTDVVALGCSDSGGRRTPRGRGYDRGGWQGATTRTRVADRWDRATSGPVGSGWVREGVRGSEAVSASGADWRGR